MSIKSELVRVKREVISLEDDRVRLGMHVNMRFDETGEASPYFDAIEKRIKKITTILTKIQTELGYIKND